MAANGTFEGATWSIESWDPLEDDCLCVWSGDVTGECKTNEVAHIAGLDLNANTSARVFEEIMDLAEKCSTPKIRPYLLNSSWKSRVADETPADALRLTNPAPVYATGNSKTLNWYLYWPRQIQWKENLFRASMPRGVTLPKRLVGKRQRKSAIQDQSGNIEFLKAHSRTSTAWKSKKTEMIKKTIEYNDALRVYKGMKSKN